MIATLFAALTIPSFNYYNQSGPNV